jgi:hypothetical protein
MVLTQQEKLALAIQLVASLLQIENGMAIREAVDLVLDDGFSYTPSPQVLETARSFRRKRSPKPLKKALVELAESL